MSHTYTYLLICDDDECYISGDHEIDLREAVQQALASLSNEEVLRPHEDWFYTTVFRVCEQQGFSVVEGDKEINVEALYWREHHKRAEVEDTAETNNS